MIKTNKDAFASFFIGLVSSRYASSVPYWNKENRDFVSYADHPVIFAPFEVVFINSFSCLL